MKKKVIEEDLFMYVLILLAITVLTQVILIFTTPIKSSFAATALGVLLIFIFTFMHSATKKGVKNTIIFFFMGVILTAVVEILAVNISKAYTYSGALGPKLWGMPIIVMIMWFNILYIAYAMTEHIINYRTVHGQSIWRKISISALAAMIAALAATAWDLFLDPIAVKLGFWTWTNGGSFFSNVNGGIPVSNFVGWIVVSFIPIFLFKLFFEKHHEIKETLWNFAPMLAYFMLFIMTVASAIAVQMPMTIMVGIIAMMPFVLILVERMLTTKRVLDVLKPKAARRKNK